MWQTKSVRDESEHHLYSLKKSDWNTFVKWYCTKISCCLESELSSTLNENIIKCSSEYIPTLAFQFLTYILFSSAYEIKN